MTRKETLSSSAASSESSFLSKSLMYIQMELTHLLWLAIVDSFYLGGSQDAQTRVAL